MTDKTRKAPTRVDAVEHYYALSVSFTRAGNCELRLTKFHRNPRALTTTLLGTWEAPHVGPVDASIWLQAAVTRWTRAMAQQALHDSGQATLPGLP